MSRHHGACSHCGGEHRAIHQAHAAACTHIRNHQTALESRGALLAVSGMPGRIGHDVHLVGDQYRHVRGGRRGGVGAHQVLEGHLDVLYRDGPLHCVRRQVERVANRDCLAGGHIQITFHVRIRKHQTATTRGNRNKSAPRAGRRRQRRARGTVQGSIMPASDNLDRRTLIIIRVRVRGRGHNGRGFKAGTGGR